MNITEKEREILHYLASGMPREEIAQKMLSNRTYIDFAIYQLRTRCGCRNVVELIALAKDLELIEKNKRNI